MNFTEYQEKANSLSISLDLIQELYPSLPVDIIKILKVSYAALGLGECGEVQGKVKKLIRDSGGVLEDDKVEELVKEMGDILWYIAEMCGCLHVSMDYVASKNLEKLFSRKKRGVLRGNGDNR